MAFQSLCWLHDPVHLSLTREGSVLGFLPSPPHPGAFCRGQLAGGEWEWALGRDGKGIKTDGPSLLQAASEPAVQEGMFLALCRLHSCQGGAPESTSCQSEQGQGGAM